MKAELGLGYGLVLVILGADVDEVARKAIEAVAEELPYPVRVETTAEAVVRGLEKNGLADISWVDPEDGKEVTNRLQPVMLSKVSEGRLLRGDWDPQEVYYDIVTMERERAERFGLPIVCGGE